MWVRVCMSWCAWCVCAGVLMYMYDYHIAVAIKSFAPFVRWWHIDKPNVIVSLELLFYSPIRLSLIGTIGESALPHLSHLDHLAELHLVNDLNIPQLSCLTSLTELYISTPMELSDTESLVTNLRMLRTLGLHAPSLREVPRVSVVCLCAMVRVLVWLSYRRSC